MKYAFFDVDNTLYQGYSASELIHTVADTFARPELTKQHSQVVEDYFQHKTSYNAMSQVVLDLASEAVSGMNPQEVQALVREMLQQKPTLFAAWVREVMDYLNAESYRTVLVSGGPDVVIQELARLVGSDEWYATEITMDQGVYTGQKTKILNELAKAELITSLLAKQSPTRTIAFGDSPGDVPMLELADTAFVAKSDHHPEMLRYAQERNWTVFETAEEVITKVKIL
ncbi:HAD-IB family hydrolase [Candidatus Woesebacteria bacterium]|nr:HAD-IB family hydrolase [Candidatus Woesebacteria bacterium]MCD8507491.1 HAD-IB family hydrolase [Candidatus Woesebacteria bacterium]MCD8526946.1 HAD-IB family hydrolase [Candidatus Woesebacteria bacterium]MCD8545845.1 HAD-IB family hydrolase [Candidatus Woesebacteria bacterium]